jgi:hypothetical protein
MPYVTVSTVKFYKNYPVCDIVFMPLPDGGCNFIIANIIPQRYY